MTTSFKTKGNSYLAVDVEDDAHDFEIEEYLFYKAYYMGLPTIGHMQKLPPGKWELIGQANSLTEEQWREIVETQFDTFINYEDEEIEPIGNMANFTCNTATASGQSLLAHYNIKPTAVIVKQVK